MDNQKIAAALKAYIESNRIKQSELAELLGISQPTVSNILSGRFPLSRENATALIKKFPELDITFLLTGAGDLVHPSVTQNNVNGNNNYDTEALSQIKKYADEALASKQETLTVMQDLLKTQQALIEAKQESADLRDQIIELIKGQNSGAVNDGNW